MPARGLLTLAPPLVLAVAATLLSTLACGQLQPRPRYLNPSSFSPATHPKGCPLGTLFVSSEVWWEDELFTRTVPPLGHFHLEICWPQHQVLGRTQRVNVDTLQHRNPSAISQITMRLLRPDFGGLGFASPAECGGAGAIPRDLFACRMGLMRSSLTPLVCNRSGGVMTASYAPNPTDTTNIDCRWRDQMVLNSSAMTDSGQAMFVVEAREAADSDPVPSGGPGSSLISRTTAVEAFLTSVLPDKASARCSKGYWCGGWHDPRVHSLTSLVWTNGVQYSMGVIYPVFRMPVGGMFRLAFSAAPPNLSGTDIIRHIITLNANFHSGNPGTVVRNATGLIWQTQLPLNLTALQLPLGWNKLTLQGKAMDPATRGIQTCSLSFMFELVPRCPPTWAPFMTHAAQDSINSITLPFGQWISTAGSGSMTLAAPTTSQQSYALLAFDLSFLAPTIVRFVNATLVVRVNSVGGAASAQAAVALNVFDGTVGWAGTCGTQCPPLLPPGMPCIAPACPRAVKVGSGRVRPANDTATYIELKLSTDFVARFAGRTQPMPLAVALARLSDGVEGSLVLASSTSSTPPFLMLSANCSRAVPPKRGLLGLTDVTA